ncbi:unnamed protein product [Ectocarpus sp. CCAP 1310/34]|nr:unnamed protein product [Ectocarpus sp. CCAP 1310/34]
MDSTSLRATAEHPITRCCKIRFDLPSVSPAFLPPIRLVSMPRVERCKLARIHWPP